MGLPDRLDVVIASALPEPLVERVADDPRVRVHHDPALIPPQRWPADHTGDPSWRRDPGKERAWAELLRVAQAVYGVPRQSPAGYREVLASCPRLKLIQATNAGAGEQVRAAELGAAELERVAVATAAGVHAVPLAEFTMLGLLALAMDLRGLERDRAARTWPSVRRPRRELGGQTLLILGLGQIGGEIARLASAFGMHVIGVRRTPRGPVPGVAEVHSTERLPDLLPRADAVVATLPLTEDTAGLLDAQLIAKLRRGAFLVNVGRGGVVDEQALLDALRSGHIAGAALDVFPTEPLPHSNPLWELPNVLISPHTAALSEREDERLTDLFIDNLGRLLAGEPIRNRILPDRPY
jgi:glyoxylate/hydroxypyruvate reductase A